jgi:predicted RNA-binding Zn ribbon-like protein
LVSEGDDFTWKWADGVDPKNMVLWTVALSAANLLTSDKASRVRVCEDDRGCGVLFIDMSKNHSRRWCSMQSCGNRAKAHRHYSRVKCEEE